MNRIGLSLLLIALFASPVAAQPAKAPAAQPPAQAAKQPTKPPATAPAASQAPSTLMDQASYGIGVQFARQIKADDVEVNAAMVARGLLDALAGKDLALTDEQMEKAFTEFQKVFEQQVAQRTAAFLADNAKQEGVVVLPSGLQYKVIKQGTGPQPKETDTVRVHYHGTFVNGKVFDSSKQRGEPAEFQVNGVIKGWTEALQLMHVGDVWQLVIPGDLAYGKEGNQVIPPNTTLVFQVELLEIVK